MYALINNLYKFYRLSCLRTVSREATAFQYAARGHGIEATTPQKAYLTCIFYLQEFQRKIRIFRPKGDLYNRKRVTIWRPYNRFSVVPDNAESNRKMSRKALSQAKCLPGQRWAILWRCKDTAFEIFDLHFFFSNLNLR